MRKLFENKLAMAAAFALFTLALTWNAAPGFGALRGHGPSIPPEGCCSVAHGPSIPPEGCCSVAHGPSIPPEGGSSRVAHGPSIPPEGGSFRVV